MGPLPFLTSFRKRLSTAGIRFAITSGQACVYYGIQQTTKDSDWIVEPDDLEMLVELLVQIEVSDGFSVSHRAICGAPCSRDFLANGWTTHIQITDAENVVHHLDFFGKAPRVTVLERDTEDSDYASRLVVAQMKKTDREKDWPFVVALSHQAIIRGDVRGVLHGQDADWLIDTWRMVPVKQRETLVTQRPLLNLVDRNPNRLRRALAIEKHIWQSINRYRYRPYQIAWKEFFRQWRREPNFAWPPACSFHEQSQMLHSAATKYKLPNAPLDESMRVAALLEARRDAIEIFEAADAELDQIVPPLEWMLP